MTPSDKQTACKKKHSFAHPLKRVPVTLISIMGVAIIALAPFNAYRIPLSHLVTLSASKVFLIAALGLLFARLTTSEAASIRFTKFIGFYKPVTLSYSLLLFVFALMLLRSDAIAFSLKIMALSTIVVSMSFIIAYLARSHGRFVLILKVLFTSSLFVTGFGVFQIVHFIIVGDIPGAPFLEYFPLPHDDSRLHTTFMWYIPGVIPRITSVMTEPNSLGHYLAIILFISAWVVKYRSPLNFSSKFTGLAILSNMMAIVPFVMTFSRSGWITFILGIGILSLDSRVKTISRTIFIVIIFCILLVSMVQISPELGDAFLQRIKPADAAGHAEVRLHALELYADAPLFGVGFGNYGVLTGGPYGVSSTHSYYITYLVEGGIPGGVAFALFISSLIIIFILKSGGGVSKSPYWLLGFGIAVMTAFNNILYHTFWLETTWISLGIAFSSLYIFSTHRNRI